VNNTIVKQTRIYKVYTAELLPCVWHLFNPSGETQILQCSIFFRYKRA